MIEYKKLGSIGTELGARDFSMIYYDQLPLSEDILKALAELKIDYAFQPIFYADGKTIYAREALMRPHEKNVLELIDEYTKADKLHVLEVATFFGAAQAYILRGYTEKVSINSFPSECFTEEEDKAFDDYFGDYSGLGIIEILEYPELSWDKWEQKNKTLKRKALNVSLDDFGTGNNDMDKVNLLNPEIVKLDRSLITDIDSIKEKQDNCCSLIDQFHLKGIKVVAEGIETKEEFDFLVSIGADFFQGYYLGRPM